MRNRRPSPGPEFDMVFLLRTLKESPRKGPIKVTQATIKRKRKRPIKKI